MPTETTDPTLAARLDTLEVRIAYQDQLIEQLNGALIEQWQALKTAQARIDRLEQRLHETLESMPSHPQDEPPPPHY